MTTIAHRERLKRIASARIDRLLTGEQSLELVQSREAASPIVQSMETGKESMHITNLPNRGQIANLPPEAVVETIGLVVANGAEGIAM